MAGAELCDDGTASQPCRAAFGSPLEDDALVGRAAGSRAQVCGIGS